MFSMNLQRDSATGQEMLSKHVEKWKSGKWKSGKWKKLEKWNTLLEVNNNDERSFFRENLFTLT